MPEGSLVIQKGAASKDFQQSQIGRVEVEGKGELEITLSFVCNNRFSTGLLCRFLAVLVKILIACRV